MSDSTLDGDARAEHRALERLARLREGVRGLGRTRPAGRSPERPLLIAGAVMFPLGLALILVGWYGAAHTPRIFEQIPYAISGGILGGALIVAGGFLYFGYWLTRLVHDGHRQSDHLAAAVERLDAVLAALTVSRSDENGSTSPARRAATSGAVRPAAVRSGPSRTGSDAGPAASPFVATATGSMLHRADCAVVAGREGLRRVAAGAEGYKPCRICEPYAEAAVGI